MTNEPTKRISKFLADAGVASRRQCEEIVLSGFVSINGFMCKELSTKVSSLDVVKIKNKIVRPIKDIRLFAFYKPTGCITTNYDPKGRRTVFDALKEGGAIRSAKIEDLRLICVGRLDYNTEGLLLLTNNGELARELTLPSSELKRVYRVRFYGVMTTAIIKEIESGLTLDGIKYGKAKVELEGKGKSIDSDGKSNSGRSNNWVRITISEGKNREIRRIMEHFQFEVSRLIRVQFGKYSLADLKPSEIMEVSV